MNIAALPPLRIASEGVGRQVVEQQNGRAVTREVVLERQNLPPVAQGALAEQADFRERIEHDALGLGALDGLEDCLRGFAEFEIGSVEQTLLLIGVEQALRRRQLEHLDLVTESPAVRPGRAAQLGRRFGECDVKALLAFLRAFHQEAQRDGRLARARSAFEKEDAAFGEAAGQDVVEALHACAGLGM
jgi:hypothetical protein